MSNPGFENDPKAARRPQDGRQETGGAPDPAVQDPNSEPKSVDKEKESLLRRIQTHQQSLRYIEEQIARHAMDVPLRLLNERDFVKEQLEECQRELRSLGRSTDSRVSSAVDERRQLNHLEETSPHYQVVGGEGQQALDDDIEHWFRQALTTTSVKYFVITLSLFHGLKWTDFWDIYQAILEAKNLQVDEAEDKGASLFEQTDEEMVHKARARIVRKEDQAAEIIEFTDSGYAQAVLDLLRQKFRPRLVELLPGLGKLGEHPYWEIRARAAYAVAEIAKLDFHRARQQVLDVWAQDNRAHVRAAVGYAASRLIDDSVADDLISRLLNEWSDPEQDMGWKLRWTAAAAYKQIGLSNPDLALGGLHVVARNDDLRVADAVIYALLVIGFDDKLPKVVETLGRWLDEEEGTDKDPNVVPLVATLAFLALGNACTSVAKNKPAEGEQEKDHLLCLLASDGDQASHGMVLGALNRAVKYKLMDDAFEVLKGWARQVKDGNGRLPAVRDLVSAWYMRQWESRHEISMAGIWNRLQRWSKDEDGSVQATAQAAMAEIKRRVSAAPVPPPPGAKPRPKSIVFN